MMLPPCQTACQIQCRCKQIKLRIFSRLKRSILSMVNLKLLKLRDLKYKLNWIQLHRPYFKKELFILHVYKMRMMLQVSDRVKDWNKNVLIKKKLTLKISWLKYSLSQDKFIKLHTNKKIKLVSYRKLWKMSIDVVTKLIIQKKLKKLNNLKNNNWSNNSINHQLNCKKLFLKSIKLAR